LADIIDLITGGFQNLGFEGDFRRSSDSFSRHTAMNVNKASSRIPVEPQIVTTARYNIDGVTRSETNDDQDEEEAKNSSTTRSKADRGGKNESNNKLNTKSRTNKSQEFNEPDEDEDLIINNKNG